ncbi:hypothetical protein E5676_scaffold95G00700 [Cucumis melo var. makuwa]|uniref:Uncharacterized protein n=1 Tax=Cucumis melo var. makuwa TaxID=1194695 RepID=A0A5D3DUU0_CUCMM|nr:hypothetical protein E5676_scaffold95G00700 [Cucumis melo var. makuwa]
MKAAPSSSSCPENRPRPHASISVSAVVSLSSSSSASQRRRAVTAAAHLTFSLLLSPSIGVREVALKFLGFTTTLVGDSAPLLGLIRLDVELNKDFSNISGNGNARGRPARDEVMVRTSILPFYFDDFVNYVLELLGK